MFNFVLFAILLLVMPVSLFFIFMRIRRLAQPRLGEFLLTIYLGVAILSALFAWTKPDPEATSYIVSIATSYVVFVVMFFVFTGSAWAWSVTRRLNETNAKKRLWMLVKGWLAVIGALTCPVWLTLMGIWLLAWVYNWRGAPPKKFMFIFAPVGLLGLLVIPAWRVERELRKAKKRQGRGDSTSTVQQSDAPGETQDIKPGE